MNAKEKNIFQSPCEIVSHFLAFGGFQFGLFVCFQSQGQVGWVGGARLGWKEFTGSRQSRCRSRIPGLGAHVKGATSMMGKRGLGGFVFDHCLAPGIGVTLG